MPAVTTPYDDRALAPGPKPLAVTAAVVDVLRSGGTAVDAMVTAVLLQQVVEPDGQRCDPRLDRTTGGGDRGATPVSRIGLTGSRRVRAFAVSPYQPG